MQVLTVHSPFRVENLTNQQLEFNVHLFRGPQALGAPSKGAAAISMVPNRPLSPGQQTYLPVPAIWSVTAPQLQSLTLNMSCQGLKLSQDWFAMHSTSNMSGQVSESASLLTTSQVKMHVLIDDIS